MGISSAAEAKLEASIRPEITVMRARTSYPRRRRPALTALPALPAGESGAARSALPTGQAGAAEAADAGAGLAGEPRPRGQAGAGEPPASGQRAREAAPAPGAARLFLSSASFTSARTIRTATTFASPGTLRPAAHSRRRAGPARPAPVAVAGQVTARHAAAPAAAPATGAAVGQVRVARHAAAPAVGVAAGRIRPQAGLVCQDAARGRRPAPVRLTRRGRFVVGLLAGLAIASAAALIWLAATGQAQAASKMAPVPAGGHGMLRVVVRPGQTLWSIAEKADPAADPRMVIQQIVDDNALSGTSVNAGQVLWVPRV